MAWVDVIDAWVTVGVVSDENFHIFTRGNQIALKQHPWCWDFGEVTVVQPTPKNGTYVTMIGIDLYIKPCRSRHGCGDLFLQGFPGSSL